MYSQSLAQGSSILLSNGEYQGQNKPSYHLTIKPKEQFQEILPSENTAVGSQGLADSVFSATYIMHTLTCKHLYHV